MPEGIQAMAEQTPPAPEPDVPELVQYYRLARNYLTREGKVIREAKGTFGLAALAIVAATIWPDVESRWLILRRKSRGSGKDN
jgi:hypothetical protein